MPTINLSRYQDGKVTGITTLKIRRKKRKERQYPSEMKNETFNII